MHLLNIMELKELKEFKGVKDNSLFESLGSYQGKNIRL